MVIDDNITLADDGRLVCAHCGEELGPDPESGLTRALRRERPSSDAGPGVHADPALFTDRSIVMRQTFCPSCLVLLSTEIVPSDEPEYRSWRIAR